MGHIDSQNFNKENCLPPPLVWAIGFLCVLPFLLSSAGFDFGNQKGGLVFLELPLLPLNDQSQSEFLLLSGAFTHTILEWSAFSVALITVFLAFAHYRIYNDLTTPIIAAALFCAGFMDAFHTLAADGLIASVADNEELIPFTWAISRTFNAIILMSGVTILLVLGKRKHKAGFGLVILISFMFLSLAFGIIEYCANSSQLPKTMFPDMLITRPWDVGPLILYILGALFLFPYYFRRFPSIFAHSLLVSMIPNIASGMHMAFGSQALFDNHFNIGHTLKILAYLVPFIGLMLDYIRNYERQIENQAQIKQHMAEREKFVNDLLQEQLFREKAENIASDILNNAVDSIISINEDGTILSANPAVERLFGYDESELIMQNIKMLMPAPYHDEHDEYLAHYDQSGEKKVIGIGREVSGLRKNGEVFPLELSVSEVSNRDGKTYTGIIRDISTRIKNQQILLDKTRQLENSNKELERFAYVASHDLQEPLRMVASYTNLLASRYKDKLDQDANEFIEYAVDGAKRMQSLIQDLLAFSRIGSKDRKPRKIDTNSMITSIIHDYKILIEEKNCEIEYEDLPDIVADESQFYQLIQNLLGNAIKYSAKDKINIIRISGTQDDKKFQFVISDTGIGIEEKHYSQIFEVFRRLHNKKAYSGTGIGLAICKRIIDRHNGKIWVESEKGKGTTFYFTLPCLTLE